MPFHLPFNFPFFSRNYTYPRNNLNISKKEDPNFTQNELVSSYPKKKDSESSESFFEIFGIKLFSDDILILCILFFLYNEKVHDDELFICLLLLLIS